MPGRLIFYRTKSAVELQPTYTDRPALFVKFADGLGKSGRPQAEERRYKWEEAIVVALSAHEVADLALAAQLVRLQKLTRPLSLYHDPSQGPAKKVRLAQAQSVEGQEATAGFLSVEQGERKIHVALDNSDLFLLETTLPFVVAELLGWTGKPGTEAISEQVESVDSALDEDLPSDEPSPSFPAPDTTEQLEYATEPGYPWHRRDALVGRLLEHAFWGGYTNRKLSGLATQALRISNVLHRAELAGRISPDQSDDQIYTYMESFANRLAAKKT